MTLKITCVCKEQTDSIEPGTSKNNRKTQVCESETLKNVLSVLQRFKMKEKSDFYLSSLLFADTFVKRGGFSKFDLYIVYQPLLYLLTLDGSGKTGSFHSAPVVLIFFMKVKPFRKPDCVKIMPKKLSL